MEFYDTSVVEQIELRMIQTSKFPVRYADQKNSQELANLKSSIAEHGLLQPIVVRPLEHGFEIIAGHRRYAACKSLRWRFISCKIREFSDKHGFEIQLTENLQRKSMDPIEEAEAFQKYVVDFGWGGISVLSKKIGKSYEYVSHRMNLLKLPDNIKEKLVNNELSVSQAHEISSLDPSLKTEFAEDVVNNKLTVKQIRKMKHNLTVSSEDAVYKEDARSKESQIIRKSTLTLKITLSRIDDLIEDAHKASPKERIELLRFLMNVRRQTHSLIDDTLKYKKEISKRR